MAAWSQSANCKLEAMYCHQAGKQMVPMMMVSPGDWKANGWLGACSGRLVSHYPREKLWFVC